MNWYYFNKNAEKVGPISTTALKELARQGLITKETVIENRSGRTALAGTVNGLEFPESTVLDTAPKLTIPPPVSDDVYGLSAPESRTTPVIKPIAAPPREIDRKIQSPPSKPKDYKADVLDSISGIVKKGKEMIPNPDTLVNPVKKILQNALPSSSPPAIDNPFAIPVADAPVTTASQEVDNPFTVSIPVTDNPVVSTLSDTTNPFTMSVPSPK